MAHGMAKILAPKMGAFSFDLSPTFAPRPDFSEFSTPAPQVTSGNPVFTPFPQVIPGYPSPRQAYVVESPTTPSSNLPWIIGGAAAGLLVGVLLFKG